MSITRPQLPDWIWNSALVEIEKDVSEKVKKHGSGACVSLHEIQGLVGEEWGEFKECVHKNDTVQGRKELFDLITACLWGIVSMDRGIVTEEWEKGESKNE